MRRGELYRVRRPGGGEPRRSRVFVVVSRQVLIESRYSTVICAPVFSAYDGLATQMPVGVEHGLKHPSSVHCDQLMSIPKAVLTDFIGVLSPAGIRQLDAALRVALTLEG
jgi:mRNA interferase MazF